MLIWLLYSYVLGLCVILAPTSSRKQPHVSFQNGEAKTYAQESVVTVYKFYPFFLNPQVSPHMYKMKFWFPHNLTSKAKNHLHHVVVSNLNHHPQ